MPRPFIVNDNLFYVPNPHVQKNTFITQTPDTDELPTYDESKDKLPKPIWDGHDDYINCYNKTWEIAFRNLCTPVPNTVFVSNFIDTAFAAITGKTLFDVFKINGSGIIDILLIGFSGFFTYGPQMLIGGVCAIESSSKKVASAVTGFTGTFGYVGAMLSGLGTGLVVDKFGWNGALAFWGISALICATICLPMCFKKKKCAK